ncbi:MAG: pyruvate dehydrogenase complex dihydrolipoamide acetyltransferase [Caulobacteraceae bacterium]|nr:pyruvate dehydrogenase complex dihydrolipoamide acetyltransferase [Caulobacteraceae bacterium]
MPALSPTMEEGALAKWLVKVGDKVRAGDVIAEIETDKATMEVEAVDEGVVSEILVPEGAEGVKVNTPIARLGEGGAQAKPAPAPQASAPAQPAAKSEPAAAAAPKASASPAPSPARMNGTDARLAASPLARRIAAQRGIDLAQVAGSGPHGRIVRADVERAAGGTTPAPAAAPAPTAAAPSVAPAAPASAPGPAKSLEQMGIPPGSYDLVPLDGMKKTVARRLTESFRDVPHFPLTIDVELDALLAARARINAMPDLGGVKVSVNDLVIKAVAVALMRVPDANASYSPEGIARHHHADIAVAVAIDGGLITPIVRAAESKGLLAIAAETKDLAERARARKLKPDEYTGGTFSVSNLGMMGIRSFASILNPPQGAILSVGAGEKRPVVRDGELAVATVMTVTLTCDHRVLDGAIGARWLAVFKAAIEDPLAMIL